MNARTGTLLAFLIATTATALPAQARREPHVVRVLDAANHPIADAAVTMFCSDGLGARGQEDIVRATTDKSGRVRVELLPTQFYQAFAVRQQDHGKQATTLTPRAPTTTELRFDERATAIPERLQLHGLAAWRAHGPLRVEFALQGLVGLIPPVDLGADDAIALPPLPIDGCTGCLYAAGRLVHQEYIYGDTWELPSPREVRVRALGGDGKPVAEALLQRVVNSAEGPRGLFPLELPAQRIMVGTTDADGNATVLLASAEDPFDGVPGFPGIALVASKAGCRETWSGFAGVPYCDLERIDKTKGQGGLTCTLAAEPQTSLRILAADGRRPAALLLRANQRTPGDADSNYGVRDGVWLPVAADGSCTRPVLAKDGEAVAVVVPDVVAPLGPDDPFHGLVQPRPLVLSPDVLAAGELDLRRVVALRLAIIDANSGPARGAEVVCTPIGDAACVPAKAAMHAVADAAGRVVLPVLPGSWFVVVLLDAGWCQQRIEVTRQLPVQELHLAPLPTMAVRVVDADGKPLAGVRFSSGGAGWSAMGGPERAFAIDMAHDVDSQLLERPVTDENGQALLPLLPFKEARVDVNARKGVLQSAAFLLEEAADVLEIVLR